MESRGWRHRRGDGRADQSDRSSVRGFASVVRLSAVYLPRFRSARFAVRVSIRPRGSSRGESQSRIVRCYGREFGRAIRRKLRDGGCGECGGARKEKLLQREDEQSGRQGLLSSATPG